MDINEVLEFLREGYYSNALMIFTEATALVLGLIYVRKQLVGRLLVFYIIFDLSVLLIDLFLFATPYVNRTIIYKFANTTNTIIAATELFVYFYFFSEVLVNKKLNKLFIFLFLLYLMIVVSFAVTGLRFITSRFSYLSNIISATELLMLIPFCILYYKQVLTQVASEPLTAKPSFWIVTGIFLFSILSLPSFLITSYIHKSGYSVLKPTISAFLYIPFAFNFIFLSKAFLCKKNLTI